MKKLKKVDIGDIALSMELTNQVEESSDFLDTDTGDIVNVLREVFDDLEEENDDAIGDYPEWMEEMVENAEAILSDEDGRYVEIPKLPTHRAYEFMEEFIERLNDKKVQNRLYNAIKGKGAFRRFKDALLEWPEIEGQWFAYRDEMMKREVVEWLRSIGIEPVEGE